jgi:hypothetical protein
MQRLSVDCVSAIGIENCIIFVLLNMLSRNIQDSEKVCRRYYVSVRQQLRSLKYKQGLPCDASLVSLILPCSRTSLKAGQPQPASYLVSDEKSSAVHTTQTYVPASVVLLYFPVNALQGTSIHCTSVSSGTPGHTQPTTAATGLQI